MRSVHDRVRMGGRKEVKVWKKREREEKNRETRATRKARQTDESMKRAANESDTDCRCLLV